MPEAYVQRGAGDLIGPDVIDPLMSELAVLLARGTAEIDRSSNLQKVYVDAKYRGAVRRGQLAEIGDAFQGVTWRGKISAIAYTARKGTVMLAITLTRAAL